MKHLISITVFVGFLWYDAASQNEARFKWEANVSIGALPTFVRDHSQCIVPPLSIAVSHRFSGLFSMDAVAGYSVSQAARTRGIHAGMTFWHRYSYAGLRATVHTDPWRFERWNLYGGICAMWVSSDVAAVSAHKAGSVIRATDEHSERLFASGFLGARFALNHYWGLHSELGFGVSICSLGISYRFAEPDPRAKCRKQKCH